MSQSSFSGDGSEAPGVAQQQYSCDSCGGKLQFAAGTKSLKCPYCGHQQVVEVDPVDVVREHSFTDWLASADKPTGHVGAYTVRCTGCGANTETDKLSDACPFCGAAIVLEPDAAAMITPEAVLPFGVPQEKALELFREWIDSRWFAPNSLKSLAAHDGIQGTYLPHWTFDSSTTTTYRGQRGEHYWESETYTDGDGDTQTRQVQRTAWYPAYGTVHRVFDDILVPAVTSLPEHRLAELEPWDMPEVTRYKSEYLAGFQTLRYQRQPPEGFERAKSAVQRTIESDCRDDIGGDEQRLGNTDTDWDAVTFKLLLLPAWLAAYRYHDRVWQVMVNARTGEVIGDRPYSAWKIAGAVTALLAVLAVVLTLYSLSRH